MLRSSRKQLTPKKKINMPVEKESIETLPTQKIVNYIQSLIQYFTKYKKMNRIIVDIVHGLNTMHAELDSLGQFKITHATHKILKDLNKKWDNVYLQISNVINNIEASDSSTLISGQFGKLQYAIDKVSKSPPLTPKTQKESNDLQASLQEQLENTISIVDSGDFPSAKVLILNLRNDILHKYDQFFKLSQISKVWKRTVIDECRSYLEKINCYLDFPSGSKVQLPIDLHSINEEFDEMLSFNFPTGQPKRVRSISIATKSAINNSTQSKKSFTQIPKPTRAKSAQIDTTKGKTLYNFKLNNNDSSTNQKANVELLNCENLMKNIIEDLQLLPQSHSPISSPPQVSSCEVSTQKNDLKNQEKSLSKTPIKNRKSRLPKRVTADTPQPYFSKTVRSSTSKLLQRNDCNFLTPEKQFFSKTTKIASPSQVACLLNTSPQIEIEDELFSSANEILPGKPLISTKDEEEENKTEDVVSLNSSPKIEPLPLKDHSPPKKGEINPDFSISMLNEFALEEFLSDSDSEDMIAAVQIDKGKSPALGKLRQDLDSITLDSSISKMNTESVEEALSSFINKFEDHLPLIQTNHLLDTLFKLIQKTLSSLQTGYQQKAIQNVSKMQTLISLVEEELIDNLTLDQIDTSILEIGKSLKTLADAFFKEDPTQPVLDQFNTIQTRLLNITDGNVNHYLCSEIQKIMSMKHQIIEYVEMKQQMIKSQVNEREKIISEMNFVQNRLIFLHDNRLAKQAVSDDIDNDISDLMRHQMILIQKLSSIEE